MAGIRGSGLLSDLADARLRYVEPLPYNGQTLIVAACRMGLEGIVSKRRDAKYAAGRVEGWVKSKCHLAQEFVVGGWVQEKGRHMKSLLLGVYQGGKLTYVGSVEHRLSRAGPTLERRLGALAAKARPLRRQLTAERHEPRDPLGRGEAGAAARRATLADAPKNFGGHADRAAARSSDDGTQAPYLGTMSGALDLRSNQWSTAALAYSVFVRARLGVAVRIVVGPNASWEISKDCCRSAIVASRALKYAAA